MKLKICLLNRKGKRRNHIFKKKRGNLFFQEKIEIIVEDEIKVQIFPIKNLQILFSYAHYSYIIYVCMYE